MEKQVNYEIELVKFKSPMATVKVVKDLFGLNLKDAKSIVDNAPCKLPLQLSKEKAEAVADALRESGAIINIISPEPENEFFGGVPAPAEAPAAAPQNYAGSYTQSSNDRQRLLQLWNEYNAYDKAIQVGNSKIKEAENEITEIEKQISDMDKEFEENKKIVDSNGECLKPKIDKRSVVSVRYVFRHSIKVAAILAVSVFAVMLIMSIISPETLEKWIGQLNVSDATLVYGLPIGVGLVGGVLSAITSVIRRVIRNSTHNSNQINNYKNFDVTSGLNKAKSFFANIDLFNGEKANKTGRIAYLKKYINDIENQKKSLPKVVNTIPMPGELRCTKGVALLIQYIDTGRADTLKEAVNLYYQDVKDAARMNELRQQTEFAQKQMESAYRAEEYQRIAAENSEIQNELLKEQINAANRAADAANRAADAQREGNWYARDAYFDRISKK